MPAAARASVPRGGSGSMPSAFRAHRRAGVQAPDARSQSDAKPETVVVAEVVPGITVAPWARFFRGSASPFFSCETFCHVSSGR